MRWTTLMRGGPIAMGLVLMASVATASETTPETEPEPDLALLAGFQVYSGYAGYAGGVGSLGPVAPGAVATLEMRATERTWWMLRGAASYGTQTARGSNDEWSYRAYAAQLGTGFRYVVNQGDTIEFSPQLLVGGGYASAAYGSYRSRQWSAHASTGINLDVAVAPGFGVRMSTELLRGGYTRQSHGSEDDPETNNVFDLSLAFSPSIEARFSF